jgi:hypothetical protein
VYIKPLKCGLIIGISKQVLPVKRGFKNGCAGIGLQSLIICLGIRFIMGLWFFLSVVVAGNLLLKAYKLRISSRSFRASDDRVASLELELKAMREKIHHLDEAVFFGDFELKKQFKDLENQMSSR